MKPFDKDKDALLNHSKTANFWQKIYIEIVVIRTYVAHQFIHCCYVQCCDNRNDSWNTHSISCVLSSQEIVNGYSLYFLSFRLSLRRLYF